MYKFKEGDKVTVKWYCSGVHPGDKCIIRLDVSTRILFARTIDYVGGCSCGDNWVLLAKKEPRVYGIVKFMEKTTKNG